MDSPIFLIAAIIAFGVFFVVLPVAFDAYAQYRRRKVVRCPEEGALAEISFDAPRAALGAALGTPMLRVRACTLWPKRAHCEQRCLK